MKRIIRKQYKNDRRCGGCNWDTSTLYSFDINTTGLCANCFIDMLIDNKAQIKDKYNQTEEKKAK